jgi:hypothetical protein
LRTGGAAIDVFTGLDRTGATVLRVQYRRTATGPGQVRAGAKRAGGVTFTPWVILPDGRQAIEVGWQSASVSALRLWLGGSLVSEATKLDTRGLTIESVRLGPSAGVTSSMSGELRFDRFVSSRGSTIGP